MPRRKAGPPVRMHLPCRQSDVGSGELRSADDEHKIAMILDLFDKYRLLFKRCLALVIRVYRMGPIERAKLLRARLSRRQVRYLDLIWSHVYWDEMDSAASTRKSASEFCATKKVHDETTEDEEDEYQDEYLDTVAEGAWTDEDTEDDTGADNYSVFSSEEDHEALNEASEAMQTSNDSSGHLHFAEVEAGEDDASAQASFYEELLQYMFGLSVSLCTQSLIDGQPSSTSDYPALGIPRRPRTRQLERLEATRKTYMVSGAQSAFEEMMSLRNYGRVMAQSDPSTFLLRWSDDSQTVFYGDILQVTMSDFRRLLRYFIDEAESLCNDMMFGWKPTIDLSSLEDDMTNMSRGFSFVQHPDNQLQAAYLELLDKACTTRRRGLYRDGSWDRKAVYAYIKKDDSLRAAFAGALQTATGQVVRCKELFSLCKTVYESTWFSFDQ
ncbi:hypothetical protein FANTH_8545 [Fusarium anthophilum]|uniref:PiggyBac transposable element-derived protein domain-containing protein n=1 Tax=Fusarium anthophilum TaxID=48485 RepID=A0A8H4ZAW3_9HYPO|nr:hypothetical protein FANTH_8545 [Fusarium anthophilum]